MNYPLTYMQYQEGLAGGKLLGLQCSGCGEYTFPARAVCSNCAGRDLRPVELEPGATLRTYTVVWVAPEGRRPPYIVAIAEMDQGPWVMGLLEDVDPDRAGLDLIGRKVTVASRVVPGDEYTNECRVLSFRLIT